MIGICIFETVGTTFVNVEALTLNTSTGEGNPNDNLSKFTCQGEELAPVEFEPYAATL